VKNSLAVYRNTDQSQHDEFKDQIGKGSNQNNSTYQRILLERKNGSQYTVYDEHRKYDEHAERTYMFTAHMYALKGSEVELVGLVFRRGVSL